MAHLRLETASGRSSIKLEVLSNLNIKSEFLSKMASFKAKKSDCFCGFLGIKANANIHSGKVNDRLEGERTRLAALNEYLADIITTF